jgi:tetratricopeptide (TPR) repeat protein
MDKVYEILIHRVNAYEGTVNELTGDGIMALFGAPIALEDAPQRALRAALAIHRQIMRFSEQMAQAKGAAPIRMRIGIHSGPVVVGTVGNNLRVEFKALGDTVNLAARVQALAEPGTTLVTAETFKLTEGLFRFENLGEKQIRGRQAPVRVYQVLAPSSRRTRFDVSAERGLSPLTGRARELEILLDAFGRAKAGRGQAVSIVAEAGVGKSRLLYEFRKVLANEDVTFLEGKCLSYSKFSAYHPIVDILKSFFQIGDNDQAADIRDRVATGLKRMGIEPAAAAPYLLELLAVKDSGIEGVMISPEAQKERIIDTLNRILLKGAQLRPLVLAIEDLHWMDASSTEAVAQILDNIPAEKVLVMLTYRPQFTPGWATRSYHCPIVLSRLSDRECLSIACHVLQSDQIEEKIRELLVEKTEGVPFFVEEFVRSLVSLGIIAKKEGRYQLTLDTKGVRIPSTIHDIIMSRIDVLPETARQILRTGSAIEREFSYRLIQRATAMPEEALQAGLSLLKKAELIYQRGAIPEAAYVFKHALTMEALYGSILTDRKQALHQRIGEAIEEIHAATTNEHCAALTRHFIESGDHAKAAQYAALAAKRAQQASAYSDAIEYARKSISALEQLSGSETVQRRLIDARTLLGSYFVALNRHTEAKDAVDPIVDQALALDYRKRLPAICVVLGSYWHFRERFDSASDYLHKAIEAAQQTSDWFNFWRGNYFLAANYFLTGEIESGLRCFQICLAVSERTKNLPGTSFAKGTMSASCLLSQGRISSAYKLSGEALQAAEACADVHTKGMAYSAHGGVCFCKGDFEIAFRFLPASIELCRKSGHAFWKGYAEYWLASTYYYSRKYKEAQIHFRAALATFKDADVWPSMRILLHLNLQMAIAADGGVTDRWLLSAQYRQKNKAKVNEGMLYAIVAQILVISDPARMAEAETLLMSAIDADERNGTRWSLAQDYAGLGELYRQKGDRPGALKHLNRSIEIMEECGADGWVERYRSTLLTDKMTTDKY